MGLEKRTNIGNINKYKEMNIWTKLRTYLV